MELNFRALRADEIEARIARVTEKFVMVLLYKDARCDMNILDETVGPENWQRNHEVIKGNLFCNVGIRVNDWVWKQDVGVESNTEAQKGEASDSFKRACFNWGIGRELYTAPQIKFWEGQYTYKDGKCFDSFEVTEIEIKDHKITLLKVKNTKTEAVFTWDIESNVGKVDSGKKPSGRTEKVDDIKNMKIAPVKVKILQDDIESGLMNKDKLLKYYKIEKLEDMTEEQFSDYAKIKNKGKK